MFEKYLREIEVTNILRADYFRIQLIKLPTLNTFQFPPKKTKIILTLNYLEIAPKIIRAN